MKLFKTSREVWSWALYDWANSAFAITIMAGFFPVFFKQYWSHGVDSALTTARLGTVTSAGSLAIALLTPFLGAMADLRGHRKLFTFVFMITGAVSCMALASLGKGEWQMAAMYYVFALMSFNASCTFYDALLPSIAPGKDANFVSSLGYSMGYLGGGVIFTLNVVMYLKPELFGLEDGITAVKASFASVGIWWVLFSIPLFRNVREPSLGFEPHGFRKALGTAGRQLFSTVKDLSQDRNLMLFIVSYWLYIDGVYTVTSMGVDFGISLGFAAGDLMKALLIVQFISFPCALIFSKFSSWWGNRVPILICLVLYSVTLFIATSMSEVQHFYMLAAMVGLIQGGVQALSRSMFSQMIPPEKSGEYFGFFNVVGRFAAILGPLLVGWGTFIFDDHRKGLLGILLLFVLGGPLLWMVKEPKAQAH